MLTYIVLDGDDIGQMIAACYFNNDIQQLSQVNALVEDKITKIAKLLQWEGFTILFCAADGVAAQSRLKSPNFCDLYRRVTEIGGAEITFSAGVGESIREAYIALLTAKSRGKARIVIFQEMQHHV